MLLSLIHICRVFQCEKMGGEGLIAGFVPLLQRKVIHIEFLLCILVSVQVIQPVGQPYFVGDVIKHLLGELIEPVNCGV